MKEVIRKYPQGLVTEMEKKAVSEAIYSTETMPNGYERLKIVDLTFWKKSHTLQGAANEIPCDYWTARKWRADFIELTAEKFGLLSKDTIRKP